MLSKLLNLFWRFYSFLTTNCKEVIINPTENGLERFLCKVDFGVNVEDKEHRHSPCDTRLLLFVDKCTY